MEGKARMPREVMRWDDLNNLVAIRYDERSLDHLMKPLSFQEEWVFNCQLSKSQNGVWCNWSWSEWKVRHPSSILPFPPCLDTQWRLKATADNAGGAFGLYLSRGSRRLSMLAMSDDWWNRQIFGWSRKKSVREQMAFGLADCWSRGRAILARIDLAFYKIARDWKVESTYVRTLTACGKAEAALHLDLMWIGSPGRVLTHKRATANSPLDKRIDTGTMCNFIWRALMKKVWRLRWEGKRTAQPSTIIQNQLLTVFKVLDSVCLSCLPPFALCM